MSISTGLQAHFIHLRLQQMTEKLTGESQSADFSKAKAVVEGELGAQTNQQWMRAEDGQTGRISSPRTPPSLDMKPKKGSCLKTTTTTAALAAPGRAQDPFSRRIRFEALGARCLITNEICEGREGSQDGKAWRRQESARASEERMQQALSGASEYQPRAPPDRWADRGWESAGLGEDTPMLGMSQDMDIQAARWREFDQRLEEQLALAARNRAAMENEVRSGRYDDRDDGGWRPPSAALRSVLG